MGRYYKHLGYEDAAGRMWRGRKPDGWPQDNKAPDGFTVSGFRKVSKAGTIRFAGIAWTDQSYRPGMIVRASLACPLGSEIMTAAVDPKWTPDNIADDYRAFLEHANRPYGDVVHPTDAMVAEANANYSAGQLEEIAARSAEKVDHA